jgi:hypothetical protein
MLFYAEKASPNTYSSPKLEKLPPSKRNHFWYSTLTVAIKGQKTCSNCCFRNQTTGRHRLPHRIALRGENRGELCRGCTFGICFGGKAERCGAVSRPESHPRASRPFFLEQMLLAQASELLTVRTDSKRRSTA